ncbi:macro domain-containing protein [Acaryochloris marina]|uniref:Appr-1-p processing enzyme family, putative n=1 Tax=Acaryochloris marina (strain MBIC 11017) TaxID=329726 RepID=B0CAV1_ACAM1|nr:macro domain-containing protein [Acaryochloris marina]ABW30302.1 appr-1-p processing enzyme family, putative [Acaryochloris marina MBIC11017]BDM79125.1 tail protein [Acaryochloris marina MBIC10699]
MELHLVDQNPAVVTAWQTAFANVEGVFIHPGDILSTAEDTIVSPANSYGYMDGGIDHLYIKFFGLKIQTTLQKAIDKRSEGYLPVGCAEIIQTAHPRIPYMIAAPTMVTPEAIPSKNCFYAMMAILNLVSQYPQISKLFCPGLGTGIGCVEPHLAAQEMAMAYRKWLHHS